MLSGELAKKQLCTCSTFFLYISLPLFCTTTTSNFQKLLSYMFYGGNVVRALVQFFSSLPLTFTLVAPSISHFLTAAAKFSHSSSKQTVSFVFYLSLQLPVALFLVDLRWPLACFLFFSVFFFLYIPNFWT